mmetsp:Transcript_98151/g.256324  ORF Transcript_98151/g.256324 Transcript_98151/m.256324 type:complete len:476 (+) Transcript_98151:80-1507(+)
MIGRRSAGSSACSAKPRRNWRLDLEAEGSGSSDVEGGGKARSSAGKLRRGKADGLGLAQNVDVLAPEPQMSAGGSSPSRGPSPKRARHDGSNAEGGSSGEDDGGGGGARKEKAFAWMDSDDESEHRGEESGEEGQRRRAGSVAPGQAAILADGPGGGGIVEEDLLTQLRELQTFAGFVRLTESLVSRASSMASDHFVELCRAAARVKYFDGDLFGEVFKHLVPKIKAQELALAQLADIVQSLVDLNACDAAVTSATAAVLIPRVGDLDKVQRLRWLDLLKDLKGPQFEVLASALKTAPCVEDDKQNMSTSGKIACRHYARGFCAMGKNCTFAHEAGLTPPPMNNPVVMTQLQQDMVHKNNANATGVGGGGPGRPACRHFTRGFCQMGIGCSFRHTDVNGLPLAGCLPMMGMPMMASMPRPAFLAPPMAPSPSPRFPMPLRTTSKPCIHFASGNCQWGAKCHFVHIVQAVAPAWES